MIPARILKNTSASVSEKLRCWLLVTCCPPENYIFIESIFILDSLEKDISSLYQELSENAAASTGAINAEDLDDVNEASDCVTMEFLDQQISGNTGNSKNISARRLTDSPEF